MNCFYFFFFFQAEDGIRDYKVTGVQTCALPICPQQPMVAVYDANGRVGEGRIWPQGARSVRIIRTAMTRDRGILAGGWAMLQNGTTPGYLAKTDRQGNTIESVYTGDFKPEQICEAPDETV